VESKNVGMDDIGESLDEIKVFLVGVETWEFEFFVRAECVIFIGEDLAVKVVVQKGNDKPSVLVISDSTTVVTFSDKILECFKGDLIILIQEHFELSDRYSEVTFIELIRNVPPEWSILSTFLNDGMEETQRVSHFLEILWLVLVTFEELF
jgi:hypothetical protein